MRRTDPASIVERGQHLRGRQPWLAALIAFLLGGLLLPAGGLDLDTDLDTDLDDLSPILVARNTPAGPGNPLDLDGDGFVTTLDARIQATQCDQVLCSRPLLSNLAVLLIAIDGCGAGLHLFDTSSDYDDPAGAVTSSATLTVDFVFHPSGSTTFSGGPNHDLTGDGFTGTIGLSFCIGFGGETSVDISHTVRNANGVSGNTLTQNAVNPAPPPTHPGSTSPRILPTKRAIRQGDS